MVNPYGSTLEHEPIIEKCVGCNRIGVGPERGPATCTTFFSPASKWRIGNCPMASHVKRQAMKKEDFVDPLKKSKQMAKGRRN